MAKKRKGRKLRAKISQAGWEEFKAAQHRGRKPSLSEEDQIRIVMSRLYGAPVKYLAKQFKVCIKTIYRIDSERIKREVPEVADLVKALESGKMDGPPNGVV